MTGLHVNSNTKAAKLTRSEIMSRIKSKNTKPEMRLRRALRAAGLTGYRLHWGPYHADVAFVGHKVAVFVDGAFWHWKSGKLPKTNTEFWRRKFTRSVERAGEANRALRRGGWTASRSWDTDEIMPIGRIRRAVNAKRRRA